MSRLVLTLCAGLCLALPASAQFNRPTFPFQIYQCANASISSMSGTFVSGTSVLAGTSFYVWGFGFNSIACTPWSPWYMTTQPLLRIQDPSRGSIELDFTVISDYLIVARAPGNPGSYSAYGPLTIVQRTTSLFGTTTDNVLAVSPFMVNVWTP